MRGLARLVVPLLAAGSLLLAAGVPAYAAEGKIVSSTQENGQVTFVFTAQGLDEGVAIDPASAQVTADNTPLPTQGSPFEEAEAPPSRTAVLVMDISDSMNEGRPPRIDAAKEAAVAYVNSLPADVLVGLVTFEDAVDPRVQPTQDRGAILQSINDIGTGDGTALYSGVVEGVRMAASSGGTASVLVLADGADSGLPGTATADDAVAQVGASGVRVDAVGIGAANLDNLTLIATAGGGTAVASGADVAQLSATFQQAAQTIVNQINVVATIVPEVADREVQVTVSALAGDETVSATGTLLLGNAVTDPAQISEVYGARPVQPQGFVPSAWLIAAVGGLFVALAVMLVTALAGATVDSSRGGRVRRRLSVYTLTGRKPVKQQETTVLGQTAVARSAVGLADRVVRERDFEAVLGGKLEAAGLSFRPAEWLLVHIGIALGSGLLFMLLSGLQLVPALVGMLLGVAGPFLFLVIKESRRTSAFLAQLPDTLQLMAGSLSAGYSMPQAVDTVVREGSPPISTEFNRALVETRLGVPVEDALEGVADRMKSKDFGWVIMAIRIQRQVGGNLAELLTTVAATLRERERLRRQVQVLSAEGRLSAWILGGLPIAFAVYLLFARGDYLSPLWTDPLGWALLLLGVVLMTAGVLWLRKVVQVEV